MIFKKESTFYVNARKKLEEYVANGGIVEEMERSHPVYQYIKGAKLTDENGVYLTMEQRFQLLGYPRSCQRKTIENGIKKALDEFVEAGGNVKDLKRSDPLYVYIKDTKMYDENKKLLTLEQKFEALGHPRKQKYSKDVKADLIKEIQEYLNAGGSFHIERKKLPFYGRLLTYARHLRGSGVILSHEEIMKALGFRNFSDDYYRCRRLKNLKFFRDENGYVDSFRQNPQMRDDITEIAMKYNVPYYFIITILCNEKLKKYSIQINRIKQIELDLKKYVEENGTLVGIKRKNPALANAFEYMISYYSDGSGETFSKKEWLDIFGLGDVENRFRHVEKKEKDIEQVMLKIKNEHPSGFFAKDLNKSEYRLVLKKAIKMGASVKDICSLYGIEYRGAKIERLSRVKVEEVPLLKEMKARRNSLIKNSGVSFMNGYCEEEIFENKLKIMKQVYLEFKDKLDDATINDENVNDEILVE